MFAQVGVVILQGGDEKTVRFAAATPRLALSRFAARSAPVRTGEQSLAVPAMVKKLVPVTALSNVIAQRPPMINQAREAFVRGDSRHP